MKDKTKTLIEVQDLCRRLKELFEQENLGEKKQASQPPVSENSDQDQARRSELIQHLKRQLTDLS